MSKTNNIKKMQQGIVVNKKRMYKAKKNWVVAGATLVMGLSLGATTMDVQQVHADEWTANTSEQIASRIASGQTSITMENGDTVWEIGQAINIANPMDLLTTNNIATGNQYTLAIGTVISWDGNHVTVKDAEGNVIGDKIVNDTDKVDASNTIANQATDTPKTAVSVDGNGNVIEEARGATVETEKDTTDNVVTNDNNIGQGAGLLEQVTPVLPTNPVNPTTPVLPEEKPVTPTNPEKPEKPTDPEKPVTPEVKEFAVSVIYKDTEGNVLDKDADVKVEEGKSFTAEAKTFEGFTLQGNATQTVKVNADKVITFTYKKNAETPIPAEKVDVTIMHVDTDGNTIADTNTVKVEDGESYTATAETIEGYTLQGDVTQTVVVSKNTTIKFVYSKNTAPVEKFDVSVQYLDENGENIAYTEVSENIEKGQVFSATAKDIDGYTVIGDTTQTITVEGNTTIKFIYKKDATPVTKFNITVEYKDVEGNLLDTDAPVEVEEGKSFTASAKTIEGYTLVGNATQTVVVNGDTTLTFDYEKDETPIVVDKTTLQTTVNNVKDTQKGNYTTDSWTNFETALGVANSVLSDAEATQAEVDQANTNLQNAYNNLEEKAPEVNKFMVTVNHKDIEGNVLDTDAPVEVEEGKSYTANAKNITGYTLQGATTQIVTVTGDTTITFNYKKDEVVPPVEDVSAVEQAIASQALALINQHRNNKGLISLNNQSALQQGADVRSEEIFTLYEHTRPNGEDGADAPYDYGYENVVFCENIGMYNNPSSLEWLAQNGASIVVNAWINSPGHNANLLLNGLNEGSVGIYLQENGSGKYTMGSVFLGAKNYSMPTKARSMETQDTQKELKFNIQETKVVGEELPKETTEETTVEEPTTETTTEVESNVEEVTEDKTVEDATTTTETTPEAVVETQEPINKTELQEAYNIALGLDETNYSMHGWSTLMISLADAKYVYDNPDVTQRDVDNAVLALQQAINNLV